jgi:hypothetical protein
LPFGDQIRSVRELLERLMTEETMSVRPLGTAGALAGV